MIKHDQNYIRNIKLQLDPKGEEAQEHKKDFKYINELNDQNIKDIQQNLNPNKNFLQH